MMTEREQLLDYIFSFELVNELIQETDEFEDIEKVTHKDALGIIQSFQTSLMSHRTGILPFVNEEYSLLSAVFFHHPTLSTFSEFKNYIESLSFSQMSEIVSNYVLHKNHVQESITIETIIESPLSDTNKWRLTTVVFSFEQQKTQFLPILEETWKTYQYHLEQLINLFPDSYEHSQALLLEGDELYQLAFSDYVKRTSYEKVSEKLVMPFLINKVVYLDTGNFSCVGIGYQTYDYWQLLKVKENSNQAVREQVLKTLVDPTRFGILKFINEGIWSNKVIAEKFDISSSAVTYQLKYLVDNRIISQDPTTRKYSINKAMLSQVLLELKEELKL